MFYEYEMFLTRITNILCDKLEENYIFFGGNICLSNTK
jgi:hypothetical protein